MGRTRALFGRSLAIATAIGLVTGAGLASNTATVDAAAAATAPAPLDLNSGAIRLSDGLAGDLATLRTGDQLIVPRQTGDVSFAGHTVALWDASTVVGFASEAAYLLVLSGRVEADGARAGAGEMLVWPPYGGKATREHFDARRFADAWSPAARSAAPSAANSLGRLARSQSGAIFFGRYQRTRFNVAASGQARRETGRRSLLGSAAVRDLRFSAVQAPVAVEQGVVERFATALAAGDAATLADLIDPTAFGGEAMGGDGAGARRAYAQALIAERNWGAQLAGHGVARAAAGGWVLTGSGGVTRIGLRTTPDFTFVSTVSTGDAR